MPLLLRQSSLLLFILQMNFLGRQKDIELSFDFVLGLGEKLLWKPTVFFPLLNFSFSLCPPSLCPFPGTQPLHCLAAQFLQQ